MESQIRAVKEELVIIRAAIESELKEMITRHQRQYPYVSIDVSAYTTTEDFITGRKELLSVKTNVEVTI